MTVTARPQPTSRVIGLAERGLPHHHRDAQVTGQTRVPLSPRPVTFYVGVSVGKERIGKGLGYLTGWGYLATDGRFGCGRYPQFMTKAGRGGEVSTTTVLRAVWHAVGEVLAGQPVIIATESRHAAAALNAWRGGSTEMFGGYVGSSRRMATLELLRRLVSANAGNLTVCTAPHTDAALTDAAGSLARLGARWAQQDLPEHDVQSRAAGLADGFLADWRSRQ